MIDTAHLYTGGESERAIGRALSSTLSGVVVATKGGYGDAGRGKPDVLRAEIEQSLASLRVARIALYYLHRVDPETPIEESLGAIKEYVDPGAIERVGISKVDVPLIERARKVVPIAAVQNEYNLAERKYDDVVDYCAREGIVFVPYYPLRVDPGRALLETATAARRHAATGDARLAVEAVAGDAPDPRYAVARAPPGKPRRAVARTVGRRVARTLVRNRGRPGGSAATTTGRARPVATNSALAPRATDSESPQDSRRLQFAHEIEPPEYPAHPAKPAPATPAKRERGSKPDSAASGRGKKPHQP